MASTLGAKSTGLSLGAKRAAWGEFLCLEEPHANPATLRFL